MFIKLAGISAALAGLFVVALEVPAAQSRSPVNVSMDRVAAEPAAAPKARQAVAAAEVTKVSDSDAGSNCRGQTWPYVDPACISSDRKPVRTIGIERRDPPGAAMPARKPAE